MRVYASLLLALGVTLLVGCAGEDFPPAEGGGPGQVTTTAGTVGLPILVVEPVPAAPKSGSTFGAACPGTPVNTQLTMKVRIHNIGSGRAVGPIPWMFGTNGGAAPFPLLDDECSRIAALDADASCAVSWTVASAAPWKFEYFFRVDPQEVIAEDRPGFSQTWFTHEFSGPYIDEVAVQSAKPGATVVVTGGFAEGVNTVVLEDALGNMTRAPTFKKSPGGWDVLAFVVPPMLSGPTRLRVESLCGASISYPFDVELATCGGLTGAPCPGDMACHYDAQCDPGSGGADCAGTCTPKMPSTK